MKYIIHRADYIEWMQCVKDTDHIACMRCLKYTDSDQIARMQCLKYMDSDHIADVGST